MLNVFIEYPQQYPWRPSFQEIKRKYISHKNVWLHGFSRIIACTFVQYSISLHLSFKIQFYNIIIDFIKNWLVLKTAYILSNSVVVHLVLLLNNICLTLNKRWPTKKKASQSFLFWTSLNRLLWIYSENYLSLLTFMLINFFSWIVMA